MKWNINEEKDLINGVTSCKKYNLPIKNAFISHSKKYDRSMLSVKNHYYKLVPKCSKEKLKDIFCSLSKKDNVTNIKDYQKPALSEKDLQALFRGLVKLIEESNLSD